MSEPACVLIVEDDPNVQETVRAGLSRENVNVTGATTAEEAFSVIETRRVDLVLLDLGLPDACGFDVLERLRIAPQLCGVPIIFLTARNTPEEKVRAFDAGAWDYVTKPFDLPELRARVRAALRAKRLQDDLAETNRDLEAARIAAESSTRAKSEFLAQMSHEIRTPMNGVIGMARLLMEGNLAPQHRELAETIYSSGDALLTIINDILDFSKIESGKLELESHPFELASCVEDVLDLLAGKAEEKGLELSYETEDGAPAVVIGDSTRLRQVLLNLVGNGIKFTSKGEVSVKVRASREPARIGSNNLEWRLHFSVRDTGIGIPPEKFGLLFKSFSQVDASTTRQFGGTGLGLAICKSLVNLMQGDISVQSQPGRGSTFEFSIRVNGAPVPAGVNEMSQPQALAGMRLLIVDDNFTNRRILKLQAQKWGIHCETVESGAKAIDLLRAGQMFDAAILDMQMPEMDGSMLARKIRQEFPALKMPLVLLTSMGTWSEAPKEQTALFVSCVNKPVKPTQLFSILVMIRKGAAAPARSAPRKVDATLGQRCPLQILLVDDNTINQKVALRLLQQIGYKADVAGNGLEAVEAVGRMSYDVVFMDVQMPEMDGMDATRRIRQLNLSKRPVVIAMTANAMQGDREKCLAAGMDDYISKPIQPDLLVKAVESWGSRILKSSTTGGQSSQSDPGAVQQQGAPSSTRPDEPVNLQRLIQFTDGTLENLKELIDMYLEQTSQQIAELQNAIDRGDAPSARRYSHKGAGSSGTCGMDGLTAILREIEEDAAQGKLDKCPDLVKSAQQEFERVQEFLVGELDRRSA